MIHRARRWIIRFDLSDEEWALLEPLLPKSRMAATTLVGLLYWIKL